MEVTPTLSYTKGEKFIVGNDLGEQTRKVGLWIFSTRNKVRSVSLKEHLGVIEELLLGRQSVYPYIKLEKIRALASNHVKLSIDVFWHGAHNSKLPIISQSFNAVVTMAGGEIFEDFQRDEEVEVA